MVFSGEATFRLSHMLTYIVMECGGVVVCMPRLRVHGTILICVCIALCLYKRCSGLICWMHCKLYLDVFGGFLSATFQRRVSYWHTIPAGERENRQIVHINLDRTSSIGSFHVHGWAEVAWFFPVEEAHKDLVLSTINFPRAAAATVTPMMLTDV